jgi:hypothetical protein
VDVMGVKGPLQMLRDLFEVFTLCMPSRRKSTKFVKQILSTYTLR